MQKDVVSRSHTAIALHVAAQTSASSSSILAASDAAGIAGGATVSPASCSRCDVSGAGDGPSAITACANQSESAGECGNSSDDEDQACLQPTEARHVQPNLGIDQECNDGGWRTYVFSVVHNSAYSVPVLYLRGCTLGTILSLSI